MSLKKNNWHVMRNTRTISNGGSLLENMRDWVFFCLHPCSFLIILISAMTVWASSPMAVLEHASAAAKHAQALNDVGNKPAGVVLY